VKLEELGYHDDEDFRLTEHWDPLLPPTVSLELNPLVPPPRSGERWAVWVNGRRCYIQKVARHWRVCTDPSGPALEGMENFAVYWDAIGAAKTWLREQDAIRRLS